MEFFYSSTLGGLHSASALAAIIFGSIVMLTTKGTANHKRFGFGYAISMIFLNLSAIPLDTLTGGFSWLHLFILMSLPTVLIGMYFPLFGRKHKQWLALHMEFMSYSYVGLLAAFMAEVVLRVPLAAGAESLNQFIMGIFVVAGIFGGVGTYIISNKRKDYLVP